MLITLELNNTVEKTKKRESHNESILLNKNFLEIKYAAINEETKVKTPKLTCGKDLPKTNTNGISKTDDRGPKYT